MATIFPAALYHHNLFFTTVSSMEEVFEGFPSWRVRKSPYYVTLGRPSGTRKFANLDSAFELLLAPEGWHFRPVAYTHIFTRRGRIHRIVVAKDVIEAATRLFESDPEAREELAGRTPSETEGGILGHGWDVEVRPQFADAILTASPEGVIQAWPDLSAFFVCAEGGLQVRQEDLTGVRYTATFPGKAPETFDSLEALFRAHFEPLGWQCVLAVDADIPSKVPDLGGDDRSDERQSAIKAVRALSQLFNLALTSDTPTRSFEERQKSLKSIASVANGMADRVCAYLEGT